MKFCANTGWSKSLCAQYTSFLPHCLAQSDYLAADRQGQGDTRLTPTPSVISSSNYVIMVSDWNCLKYFFLYCNHQVHRDLSITLYMLSQFIDKGLLPVQSHNPVPHFTRTRHTFIITSWIPHEMRRLSDQSCREQQNTLHVAIFPPRSWCRLRHNYGKQCSSRLCDVMWPTCWSAVGGVVKVTN
jgi:hypothetical protein